MFGESARPAESAPCPCRPQPPPMRLLQYKDLDLKRVKPAFAKVRAAIEAVDFKSPDVKKLHTGGYYRAKLDHSNRLLAAVRPPRRPDRVPGPGGDREPRLRQVPLPAWCAGGRGQDRARARHRGEVRRRTRRAASALAARHARRVRVARQAHRLRRRPGGRAPTARAGGARRLGRLRQDGRHVGQASRGFGTGIAQLRHACRRNNRGAASLGLADATEGEASARLTLELLSSFR